MSGYPAHTASGRQALYLVGVCLLELGAVEGALDQFRQLRTLDPATLREWVALEETAQLHWRAAQLGKVEPISNAEVRSVLTGTRYEEYFSHVWGHYEALDPWNRK